MQGIYPGRALKRGWWIVVGAVLVGSLTAWWLTTRQTRLYASQATVIVVPNSRAGSGSDLIRSLDTLERRTIVATFARLPGAAETKDEIAKALEVEPRELRRYRLRGSVIPNTNLIRIEATGPEADRAAEVANGAARVLHESARELYRIYSVRPFSRAEVRNTPVYPDPQRNLLLGGILSLFLGLAAVLLFDAVGPPARREE